MCKKDTYLKGLYFKLKVGLGFINFLRTIFNASLDIIYREVFIFTALGTALIHVNLKQKKNEILILQNITIRPTLLK